MRPYPGTSFIAAALLAAAFPAVSLANCVTTGSGANAVTVCVSLSASGSVNTADAGQTVTFTALVTVTYQTTGSPVPNANLSVLWSANPANVGTLPVTGSQSGGTSTDTYTAPASITAQQNVTITATPQYPPQTAAASITLTLSPGSTLDVGSGAPTPFLQEQFVSAFARDGFSSMVSLPPLGQVKTLGTSGYVQEFQDAAKDAGVKYALASASSTASGPQSDGTLVSVVQIWGGVYAYFLSVGVTTAGYPLSDTQMCPALSGGNTCTYQFFDKGYALFVYGTALPSGTDFSVSGAIYTEWAAQGALTGAGMPISAPATVTASTATTASAQMFTSGAVYSITSGPYKGKTFTVAEPIYDFYSAQGGSSSSLGLPISDTLVYQSGLRVQLFEHGAVQYSQGTAPVEQVPVATVAVSGVAAGTTTSLKVGQSVTLTALPVDTKGNPLTTPISWTSSNGQVVTIQTVAQGQTATVTAVGAGSASVTASSGGITSGRVNFVVAAECCTVGDSAPAAVQQAFQTALARNNISVQLPLPAPAVQVGSGYTQMIPASGSQPALLLAVAGQGGSAYVVSGAVLTAYQALGGAAGTLGYPTSDVSAAGTQRFSGGALGGNPVRLVTGPILTKWAALGFDAGVSGSPAGDVQTFTSFGGNTGLWQSFTGGSIYAATVGPRAGQAYLVSGLILAAYNANGSANGTFGMPVGAESDSPSLDQQSFEGGTISFVPGASAATAQLAPKTPAVVVAPAAVTAGGQARVAVSGFAANSAITVSITGQPNFTVSTANGAYSWDFSVPLSAASGTINIQASGSGGSAAGTLTIRGFASNRAQLAKLQGDQQTGAPGALLPLSLEVAVRDSAGNPVIGAPVVFQGVPGVQLTSASAITDGNGVAATQVRLPLAAGTALVTANSPGYVSTPVTFSLLAQAVNAANFPNLQMSGSGQLGNGSATLGQKGALLTAVSSILLYHQNRGDVGTPNGAVSPAALDQFLSGFCMMDSGGHSLCDGFLANPGSGEQVVNLWRAAQFTGGLDVTAIAPTVQSVADLVSQSEPVLLSLSLTLNGAPAGGSFVAATGIGADGSILIADPNPAFARANLNDYLSGFTGAAGAWQGTLAGAVRFAVRTPAATRFVLGEISQSPPLVKSLAFAIASPAGACGVPAQFVDSVDASGNPPAAGPLVSEFTVCDGSQASYEIDVGASAAYSAFVTDLGAQGGTVDLSGSAPAAYAVSRPAQSLLITRQAASIAAAGIVNAASFTPAIAPGGIMAIFGAGLASPGVPTGVDVDGTSTTVFSASSFQVNALLPAGLAPGTHTVHVSSGFGTAQQAVTVSAVAPAVFLVANGTAGALVNQDGTLNSGTNPISRGGYVTIYATGLGAVTPQGPYAVVSNPVTVVIGGTELPASFAGLTPGYAGLYQVNFRVPSGLPPGLGLLLTLKQGGISSNPVPISIE